MQDIRSDIQKLLSDEIIEYTLKGKGAVNNAYVVKTKNGSKYIVKQEREDKEFQPQNSLVVEANVIKKLSSLGLSIPVPKVVCISKDPEMYGYEYIEGELLREQWSSLSEDEKISICKSLGEFHAEIGMKVSKEDAEALGVFIDLSTDVHPEVSRDYVFILENPEVPEEFKSVARNAKKIFDTTHDDVFFQFLHNDAHHENILIKDKKISGFIDFGNAEYGEIAKEFSRYIRDFPFHFQYIVSAYEEKSGNRLSYLRLVTNSLINGLIDNVEDYLKGGEARIKAETAIATYKRLIEEAV
ncbi:MAG: Phosphotransferase enzyme family [Candidatus Parcubacteria bacterium]|jgi:Ser/Thr protein kinase RdoA (MazF antagonist)